MFANCCPYCDRVNPPDSKFCGNCGAALHLVPCPHCGAVTEVTATVCYQCRRTLPGRGTGDFAFDTQAPAPSVAAIPVPDVDPSIRDDKLSKLLPHEFAASPLAPEVALPVREELTPLVPAVASSKPSPSRHSLRAFAGTVATLGALAVLGYYYQQRPRADASQPPSASREAVAPGVSATSGVTSRDAPTSAESRKDNDEAQLTRPLAAPSATPSQAPARTATGAPRPDRMPAESQDAQAGAASTRSQAIGAASDRSASLPKACTEAAAALGLCVVKPARQRKADAAVQAVVTSPKGSDASRTENRESPRFQTCTDALAALGLCTPKPAPEKE